MIPLRKFIITLLVMCAASMIAFSLVTAHATSVTYQQEAKTPTPSGFSPSSPVFRLQGDTLQSVDVNTHQTKSFAALDSKSIGSGISQIVVDQHNNYVYILATMAQPNHTLKAQGPNPMRIVRISPNGKKDVILEASNLDRIIPSGDGKTFIVLYFEGDFGRSRLSLCILDSQTRKCLQYNKKRLSSENVRWIDNRSFVILDMSDRSIQIVDALTLEDKQVMGLDDWFILSVTPIPTTHLLLVGAENRNPSSSHSPQLLTLNWQSSQTQNLPFAVQGDRFKDYYDVGFSPNGEFFSYNSDDKFYVVDFSSGKLITTIPKVSQSQWLQDSSAFIVNTYDRNDGSSMTSVIDAQSGNIISTTKNEAGVSIIIAKILPKP